MSAIYVIVHCDGAINVCPNEGVTFTSPSAKMILLMRGITFERLKKVIHSKLHRHENERVENIYFRFPIRLGPGVSNYRCVEMNDEEDVEALFNVHDSNELQSGLELYVTFSSNQSQTPQLSLSHSPSPYQTSNPPIPTYDMNVEYNLGYYSQLLTGPSTDLNDLPSEPQENLVAGIPDEVFDPFSEDEDEVLAQHEDDDQDLEPLQHIPPSQPHLPYNPPQHFINFPTHLDARDPEFPHVLDRETNVYPPGTLFVGQRFNTKEQVQDAINRFHIVNHCTYKVQCSSQTRIIVECLHDNCDWRCRAILRSRGQHWEIMKLEGPHTCVSPLISQDHTNLGSRMISQTIREIVEADPSTPISTIIAHIKTTLGYTISYRKGWLGKQIAIQNIFGNWEESYAKLPT